LSELIVGKVGVALLGLGLVAAGVWFMRFGASITTALNRDYARLPFRFQYPRWWHRFMGAFFVAIGLLVAIAGVLGRPVS
jgi:threonine/homoserine/homoserine lactone efflux protein